MIPVVIQEAKGLKQASARFREGSIIVRVPKSWPNALKQSSIQTLLAKVTRKLQKQQVEEKSYRQSLENSVEKLLTHTSSEQLAVYVSEINRSTVNQPLSGVRIGTARFTRLAQINLKSRVITVSRFCLENVPEKALRYLVLHELVHLLEQGHNKRFWNLVAFYMPDYRMHMQRILIHHRIAIKNSVC